MNDESIKDNKRANPILATIIYTLVIICETPYLSRNMSASVVEILMLTFAVIYFVGKNTLEKGFDKAISISIVYVSIELLYKLVNISSAGIGYYFATIKFLFIFIAMMCIGPQLSRKQRYFLCSISIIGMIANMISNEIICSRMDSSAYVVYYLRDGQRTNAADTAFSTAVMLLMGALFLITLHVNNKKMKVLSLAGLIYCLYFLAFVSQRGTTFFLGIMMILAILAFNVSSQKIVFVLITLSAISLWFALGGIIPFLNWLSSLLNSERISYKINYIISFFQTGDIEEAGGSLTGRFNLIMTSIQSWLSSVVSFVFGVGDHRDTNLLVGNHSQLFDTFARYGIIGGSVFISLLCQMKNIITRLSNVSEKNVLYKQMNIIVVFFIIRSALGSVFIGSIGTQLFVTLPTVVALLDQRREKQ